VYKTATPVQVLGVCVGDTIDFPGRKTAWPKNRAELEAVLNGKAMLKVARAALERIAEINSGYRGAVKNPDKFCHGFGMFQYDIQFFKEDIAYFLEAKGATWDGTFGKGLVELQNAVTGLYGAGKDEAVAR
jgi:hypothetical protein